MRIIAGQLKGRRLQGPVGPGLRPTSDSLRETLFNVLGDRVAGARVVDGYAGTGGVGLEALSRGARRVTFVEQDPRAFTLLSRNIEHCGVAAAAERVRGDFLQFSRRADGAAAFDIVFVDPPYGGRDLNAVLTAASGLVVPAGLVVLEHSRRTEVPDPVPGLQQVRVLTAGDSALSFYVGVTPPDTMSSSGG